MGEGGFVSCNTKEDENIIRSLREWGRGCYCVGKKANLSPIGTCGCRFKEWLPSLPGEVFDHKYVYETIGYNLKPIELQCSMGLAQIDKLPHICNIRKANHARLTEIFNPYGEFFHFHKATPYSNPAWFAFPLTVRDGAPFNRSQFTRFMENNKIQTRNYFGGNLLLQPAYQNINYSNWRGETVSDPKKVFPVATKVTTDTLFLGTSPVITKEQLDYVQEKVQEFFKQYGNIPSNA
jgi:CDP-6-deoxy-D-xylo-4-hexulose-3-dehydrase